MRITQKELRNMIAEEMKNIKSERLVEGSQSNPVVATPELINQIIKEEFEAFQTRQKLAEAKKRSKIIKNRRR